MESIIEKIINNQPIGFLKLNQETKNKYFLSIADIFKPDEIGNPEFFYWIEKNEEKKIIPYLQDKKIYQFKNIRDETLFHWAASYSSYDFQLSLILHGKKLGVNFSELIDVDGENPGHWMVLNLTEDRIKLLKLWIAAGINPNLKSKKTNKSVFDFFYDYTFTKEDEDELMNFILNHEKKEIKKTLKNINQNKSGKAERF